MGCDMPAEQICKEFLVMTTNNRYKNLEFTWLDDNIDYYIIISFSTEFHVPERSIIFQMEPWVYDPNKNWGIKCWPEQWRNPDKTKYLHIRKHDEYLNVGQWMFSAPKEINMKRKDKFIAIISEKLMDTGHINRVNFIRYVEKHNYDIIDIYGTNNHHNFRNYIGKVDNKILQEQYKYIFTVENNREFNYATEKIWESFIAYNLAFYDGCPNLTDYIDSEAYVAIDTTKKGETLQLMLDAIYTNLWSKRLDSIIKARDLTINKYGFFPIVYSIINDI